VICKYDDLLKPLLFLIYDDPDVRKHVFEELGIAPNQFSNMTQYSQWLGHSEGAADMLYNALEVILAYLHLRRNGRLPRYVIFTISSYHNTDTWVLVPKRPPAPRRLFVEGRG